VRSSVVVARFPYRYQAEFARQILTGAGIRSALLVDDAAGMYVGMSFTNPARLLVLREDAADAERVLRDHGVLGGDADAEAADAGDAFDAGPGDEEEDEPADADRPW
jgi:hypothetical protein